MIKSCGDCGFGRRRAHYSALVAIGLLGTLGALRTVHAQSLDPVVFSFATVGDNRQDPKKPDPTTFVENQNPTTAGGIYNQSGMVIPQDQYFLQNSAAWAQIQAGIAAEGAQLLLFNGDEIYGYGRPILPSTGWTGNPSSWKTPITANVLNSLNTTYNTGASWYPDAFFEYLQYAYWRGTVSTLFSSGTYVIPVAGNHETQCSATNTPWSSTSPNPNCNGNNTLPGGNNGAKQAYVENEAAFRANMGDLIQDLTQNLRFSNVSGVFATNVVGTSPATAVPASSTANPIYCPLGVTSTASSPCIYSGGTPANNGNLLGAQTDLDYSFDIPIPNSPILLHFAVINTDPAGADATAPSDWLAGDFAAAAARAAAGGNTIKYFVFGHKPAFTYNYEAAQVAANPTLYSNTAAGGLDANSSTSPNYQQLFWHVIAQYNATYFCGHEHIPNVQKFADPTPNTTVTNTPYQVIVGSGGSPFDDTMDGTAPNAAEPTPLTQPTDRYYAWALVQVHQSGAVTLKMHGFPDTGIGGSLYELTNYEVPGAFFTGNLQ